jgi:hypothetical protein
MNECLKLGSGEDVVNDRKWVSLAAEQGGCSRPVADIRLSVQSELMTLKRLGLAFVLSIVAAFAAFFPIKAALTLWYMQHAPNDGQSALGVIAGALYLTIACGALTFGITLQRNRRRP